MGSGSDELDHGVLDTTVGPSSKALQRTCGILPFRRPRHRTSQEIADGAPAFSGWGINVRCLEGVDLDPIPVKRV